MSHHCLGPFVTGVWDHVQLMSGITSNQSLGTFQISVWEHVQLVSRTMSNQYLGPCLIIILEHFKPVFGAMSNWCLFSAERLNNSGYRKTIRTENQSPLNFMDYLKANLNIICKMYAFAKLLFSYKMARDQEWCQTCHFHSLKTLLKHHLD